MKMVRFSYQALIIVLLFGAVFVMAANQITSNYDNFLLSPFLKGEVDPSDKIEPALLEEFETEEVVRIIVNVRDKNGEIPEDEGIINSVMKDINQEKIEDVISQAAVASLNVEEVRKIARNRYVNYVQKVHYAKPLLPDVVQIVGAEDIWLEEINSIPLTGEGQSICIVDTGIDFTHPDLAAKNIAVCTLECPDDLSGDCPMNCSATDTDGHGTNVAGIAGAEGGVNGVGKGADLIAMKVFPDGEDVASELRLWNAVVWCRNHAEEYGISVISMSLGNDALHESFCNNGFLATKIEQVVMDNNIAVIASTGNDGSTVGINWPSCVETAIPVSATKKDDSVAGYANYNSLVSLFSPGGDFDGGGFVSTTELGGGYDFFSGTSASAPGVAGAFAIFYQALELTGQPMSMNPLVIEQDFFETGDGIVGLPLESWTRINANSAVLDLLGPMCFADFDGDGIVGTPDLLILLGAWGANPGHVADIDGDGIVGTTDLLILLGEWGPCNESVNGGGGQEQVQLPPNLELPPEAERILLAHFGEKNLVVGI